MVEKYCEKVAEGEAFEEEHKGGLPRTLCVERNCSKGYEDRDTQKENGITYFVCPRDRGTVEITTLTGNVIERKKENYFFVPTHP